MTTQAKATFIGCENAVAFAAATCPDCGRKGQVRVSTEAILHKTMLCADCTEMPDDDETESRRAMTNARLDRQTDEWLKRMHARKLQ
jgi:hypothetical protein